MKALVRWGLAGVLLATASPAVVAQPVLGDTMQQEAAPLPTSSRVPGMPVGRAGQWNGTVRPGEATALPTSAAKPPGQPPTQTSVGPIKVPE